MGEGYKRLLTAAAIGIVVLASSAGAGAETCKKPDVIEFPQGDQSEIRLYANSKGDRLGTITPQQIGKLQLCTESPGKVNPILLPPGTAIRFEAGKAAPHGNIYWVRDAQIRFTKDSQIGQKKFICERNQVKSQSAGGAAGNEACEQP